MCIVWTLVPKKMSRERFVRAKTCEAAIITTAIKAIAVFIASYNMDGRRQNARCMALSSLPYGDGQCDIGSLTKEYAAFIFVSFLRSRNVTSACMMIIGPSKIHGSKGCFNSFSVILDDSLCRCKYDWFAHFTQRC